MSEPIKAGDLVVIVKSPHSCSNDRLGVIFRVDYIHPLNPRCVFCGVDLALGDRTAMDAGQAGRGAPLSWVKRIQPSAELEGQRTQEDIREPA